jgi:hypothetical protein
MILQQLLYAFHQAGVAGTLREDEGIALRAGRIFHRSVEKGFGTPESIDVSRGHTRGVPLYRRITVQHINVDFRERGGAAPSLSV